MLLVEDGGALISASTPTLPPIVITEAAGNTEGSGPLWLRAASRTSAAPPGEGNNITQESGLRKIDCSSIVLRESLGKDVYSSRPIKDEAAARQCNDCTPSNGVVKQSLGQLATQNPLSD